jgi:hypothetical protein
MADPSFFFANVGDLSLTELKRRQAIAAAVASRQRKSPTTIGEGLTYLGESIGDVMEQRRLAEAERAYEDREKLSRGGVPGPTYGGGAAPIRGGAAAATPPPVSTPAVTPNPNPAQGGGLLNPAPIPLPSVGPPAASSGGAASLGAPIVPGELTPEQDDTRNRLAGALGGAQQNPTLAGAADILPPTLSRGGSLEGDMAQYAAAIAGNETGGRADPYRVVGVETNGDRPYGKYQVMGRNVPAWTKAALGAPMTPQQFLASDYAQDEVFKNRFGGYVQAYGPEGAAQAWLGGPGSVGKVGRRDVLGTSVGSYGRQFMNRLGRRAEAGDEDLGTATPIRMAAADTGTVSDAAPILLPKIPGVSDNPETPTDIAPRPVRTEVAEAPRGVIPGAVAAPGGGGSTGAPASSPAGSVPSSERIPGYAPMELPPEQPMPPPPRQLPMSDRQRYWLGIMNSRNFDTPYREEAKREFEIEEKARAEAQQRLEADYIDKREAAQANNLLRQKLLREEPDRMRKALGERLDIEKKMREETTLAPLETEIKRHEEALKKAELAREPVLAETARQALEKAKLDYEQAKFNLSTGKEHVINGVVYRQAPGDTGYTAAPGSPVEKEKLTEVQAKQIKFMQRAVVAHSILGDGSVLGGFQDSIKGKIPIAGNYLVSPEYRRAVTAAYTWMQAVLRDESGAVIGPKEQEQAYPQYFPIPGDTPADIANKAARRRTVEQGFYETLGDAKPVVDRWRTDRAKRKTSEPEGLTQRSPSTGKIRRVIGGHWEIEGDD